MVGIGGSRGSVVGIGVRMETVAEDVMEKTTGVRECFSQDGEKSGAPQTVSGPAKRQLHGNAKEICFRHGVQQLSLLTNRSLLQLCKANSVI